MATSTGWLLLLLSTVFVVSSSVVHPLPPADLISARPPDPDRYIVAFHEGQQDIVRKGIAARNGMIHIESKRFFAATFPGMAIDGLEKSEGVAHVENDSPRYLLSQSIPYGITQCQVRCLRYPSSIRPSLTDGLSHCRLLLSHNQHPPTSKCASLTVGI
jgi:hypothetical protein